VQSFFSWRFSLRYGLRDGIAKGVFQAVSAYCNAGFDLHGDTIAPGMLALGATDGRFSSLIAWNNDPIVILTTALLIISGGLLIFRFSKSHRNVSSKDEILSVVKYPMPHRQ